MEPTNQTQTSTDQNPTMSEQQYREQKKQADLAMLEYRKHHNPEILSFVKKSVKTMIIFVVFFVVGYYIGGFSEGVLGTFLGLFLCSIPTFVILFGAGVLGEALDMLSMDDIIIVDRDSNKRLWEAEGAAFVGTIIFKVIIFIVICAVGFYVSLFIMLIFAIITTIKCLKYKNDFPAGVNYAKYIGIVWGIFAGGFLLAAIPGWVSKILIVSNNL